MRHRVCEAILISTVAFIVTALAFPPSALALPATAQESGGSQSSAQGGRADRADPTVGVSFDEQELRNAPAARDVWALLEHWMPTVISRRLDVGGSATGTQGLFSARATSWRQNVYRLDGVEVTDPAVRGTSGFYYDYDAFSSVAASWGTQSAAVATGGVLLDMRLRRGGSAWHGAAQGYFELDALQANNLSEALADQGVTVASEIDYLSDVSFQLGGPLAADRAWMFGSYRDWRISQVEPNFSNPVVTSLPVATLKVTARPTDTDDVSVFWSRQRYQNPARGAAPLVAPEATLLEESTVNVLGGTWRRTFDEAAIDWLLVRGSYLGIDFPIGIRPDATGQSQFDILTRVRSGAASLAFDSRRRRFGIDVEAGLSAGSDTARHDIVTGAQFQYAPTQTELRAIGDVNIITSGGAPFLAQLLNTPVSNKQNVRGLGLFVHDEVGLGAYLSGSFGLRYDDWRGSLPAQSSPDGTFAPAREFAADGDVIGWRSLAPRAALLFDTFGDGRLVFVGAFSQYVHQLATSTLSFANPNSLGVRLVPWNDLNGDGQFQAGEGGATMNVAGGPIGQVDPELRAPLTREFRLGLEYALGAGWNARADLWYRKDQRLFDDVEVGLDENDFETTVVRDPGPDNIQFTADDTGLQVFNQVNGFGENRLLLTTVDEKTVTYRGVDIGIRREWADNWELRATLTLSYSEGLVGKSGPVPGDAGGISDLFNDPNARINSRARSFWDRPYVLKVYGSYRLPHDIVVAGVLRSWAGAPMARILPVPLNQGIVDVFAAPRGAFRESPLTTVDLRVAKDLAVGRALQLSLYGDLFNVTNAGTVIRTYDTSPIFGIPAEIVAPMVFRMGVRVGF